MRKINLVYWNKENFGDQLSPYIIEHLSGMPICYKRGPASLRYSFKEIVRYIFLLRFDKISEMLFNWQDSLLAVGSIINLGNAKSKIWGSGFMLESQNFSGGEVYAVRGKYTAQKIGKMGFASTHVFGDPALLLPLIFNPPIMRQKGVALIPHITEYDYFLKQYGDKFDVIDFKTRDVESKISEICRYSLVLSTSLHGLIVAHAYGIPAIWIKHGYIHTDGIKFKDYFSSVNIPCYNGFENIDDIICMGESGIRLFFERHNELSLPHVSLQLLQKKLLKVAPFPIKSIYL